MYPTPQPNVERGRIVHGPLASDSSYGNNGAFLLRHPQTKMLFKVIASDGDGWEHVSVSIAGILDRPQKARRCPTWEEMCWIKDQFWTAEEEALQYHPARSQYVNNHPYVLHLWRPLHHVMPRPPMYMVGVRNLVYREA